MRFILMFVIGLAVLGTTVYFFLGQQKTVQANVKTSQESAQSAANAYKANQQKMMKELGQ